jgi:putative heme-binding domain-containing protein
MHPNELRAINQRPLLGDVGLDGGRLLCPGDPSRSVLLYRASKLGRGRMPHMGSDLVDEKGIALLRQWIGSLENAEPDAAANMARGKRLLAKVALERPDVDTKTADAAVQELLSTTSGAMELLASVDSGALAANIRQAALAKAIAAPSEPVRDLFRRFDPKEQLANRLGAHFDSAKLLAKSGDAARGKKIFFVAATGTPVNPGAPAAGGLCAKCHKLENQGIAFGPDLAKIGTKYGKAQLLENIVDPSKTITEGYTTFLLKTKSGEVFTGLLLAKTPQELVIKDAQKENHIPAGEVQKLAPSPVSAMPEGMLSDLTPQEAADLLEFLMSLK